MVSCGVSCTALVLAVFAGYALMATYQIGLLFYPDLTPSSERALLSTPLWTPDTRCDVRVFASTGPGALSYANARDQHNAFTKAVASAKASANAQTQRTALLWEALGVDPNVGLSVSANVSAWELLVGPHVPATGSAAAEAAQRLARQQHQQRPKRNPNPTRAQPLPKPLLTAHVYITRSGVDADPHAIYLRQPLTKHYPVPKNDTRILLAAAAPATAAATATAPAAVSTAKAKAEADAAEMDVWAPHMRTRLGVRYVTHYTPFPLDKIPGDVQRHLQLLTRRGEGGRFMPLLYPDTLWDTKADFALWNVTAVAAAAAAADNSTTQPLPPPLPLQLSVSPITLGVWRLALQMTASVELLERVGFDGNGDEGGGASGSSDLDQMRRLFGGAHPLLLALTFVVSFLHIIFDLLAFKNDISFWRSQKSYVGLSARSVALQMLMSAVILLYLIDSDASRLVLLSAVSSAAINAWKLTKLFRVRVCPCGSGALWLPLRFEAVSSPKPGSVRAQLDAYDAQAMRYLGAAAAPVLLGAGVYALLYRAHKSWYSWALGSCALAMYVFGFILMTPQLYVNYKLQSVQHLPWRVFCYKALNTFIDDVFAFVLDDVPLMHRLSVFRDDIVFVAYLTQRFLYRNNPKRTFVADDDDDAAVLAAAAVGATPAPASSTAAATATSTATSAPATALPAPSHPKAD